MSRDRPNARPDLLRRVVVGSVLLSVLVGSAVIFDAARAERAGPCGDVTVVFARGSGQELGGAEATAFFEHVADRIATLDVSEYELGTESHGGVRYSAAGGVVDLLEAEASWTGPLGGDYRSGVDDGVSELTAYVSQRADACPDTSFVLGGYSQGAQVVGEALFELDGSDRDRVAFVALFGDPKLYLPEGRGMLPPACRGTESSWRRGSVGCLTDNGILEARRPYLPVDVEDRTGTWCDRNDPVCNNNLTDFAHSTHRDYADDGGAIDAATQEIARVVVARLGG